MSLDWVVWARFYREKGQGTRYETIGGKVSVDRGKDHEHDERALGRTKELRSQTERLHPRYGDGSHCAH